MSGPGVLVVWRGDKPLLDTHRIPPTADGLVLGRELLGSDDDRVSTQHARLTGTGTLVLTDLGSRNGTFVEGEQIAAPVELSLPALIRLGRTLLVAVENVRPYEHVPLSRRGSVVVGGTLDRPVRELDVATIGALDVALIGPRSVTRDLAAEYVAKLGGEVITFAPTGCTTTFAELVGERRVGTIVLEIDYYIPEPIVAELAEWLELDVHFVTTMRSRGDLHYLPDALARRLTACVIEIPRPRYDELPTRIDELVRRVAPGTTLHASAIELALRIGREVEEDLLLTWIRGAIEAWRLRREPPPNTIVVDPLPPVLRASDFEPYLVRDNRVVGNAWVVFPGARRPR